MIDALPSPRPVLERKCEERIAENFLETVLSSPEHRVLVIRKGKVLVRANFLEYLAPDDTLAWLPAATLSVYLGSTLPGRHPRLPTGTDVVLKILPDDAVDVTWLPEGADFAGVKDVATTLDEADAAVLIQAHAVANWHRSHLFCSRCGSLTAPQQAGWMRRCTKDGSEHFPRTDPAAIVAIVGTDERILLASNFAWASNRFSTIAGFVEAGENGEQAAVREIAEEAGVKLHTIHYLGSQAWPFPRSLMLGYVAYTDDLVAVPDRQEVREVRWFGRAELQAAVLTGEIIISQRTSIARSLIEYWYGGTIREPDTTFLSSENVAPGRADSQ